MTDRFAGSTSISAWIAVGGCMGAVMLLLLSENLGSGFLNHLLLYTPGVDKVLHFGQSLAVFLMLYLLLWRTGLGSASRLAAAAGGALAAAGFDEIQQRWAGGRSIELADIGAGLGGITFGIGLLMHGVRRRTAMALMVCGVAAGGAITYDSYLKTRDYNQGLLAERDGRMGDARRAYLRALDAGVRHPEIYNAAAWATVESGEGDMQQAVAFAEQSLALRPANPDTLDTYGWALYRAGRAPDAVRPLEQALKAKPEIYCIHYHLGMVLLELGRREDGLRHLRLQVEQMPGTREARLSAEMLLRLEPTPGSTK